MRKFYSRLTIMYKYSSKKERLAHIRLMKLIGFKCVINLGFPLHCAMFRLRDNNLHRLEEVNLKLTKLGIEVL